MLEAIILPLVIVQAVEADAGTGDLVSNLLTGGGFVFLAALMGGLALWNKNQADSAKSIAEGSREYVEGVRGEIKEAKAETAAARADARQARADLTATQAELEVVKETTEVERDKFRRWIRRQKIANDEHQQWDDELVALLRHHGVDIRPAPPLSTCLPDDGDR